MASGLAKSTSTEVSQTLAVAYRPRSFTEVIGHDHAIKQIANLLRENALGPIIFAGPTGVGKTTLALLLAKSLLCRQPDGSNVCDECDCCKTLNEDISPPVYHRLNAAGTHGRKEEVADFLEHDIGMLPAGYNSHIIFFDEAQRLSSHAQAFLLPALEQPDSDRRFIFALTDESRLSDAFKARCRIIHLKPPSAEEIIVGLKSACRRSDIHADDDAVFLIAERATNHRSALAALQQLSDAAGAGGLITVELARRTILREETDAPLSFLKAGLQSDMTAAMAAVAAMGADAAACFKSVQRLLLVIKKTAVGPNLMPLGRTEALLYDQSAIDEIMERVSLNAALNHQSVASYFDALLEHFSFVPSPTVEVFGIFAAKFVDLCSGSTAELKPLTALERLPAVDEEYRSRRALRRSAIRSVMASVTADTAWLNLAQARRVYEAATFLVQAHGLCFNTALRIGFIDWRIGDEAHAASLFSNLGRELAQRLGTWTDATAGAGGLHRLSMLGRDSAGDLTGILLVHLPRGVDTAAQDWVDRWFRRHGKAHSVAGPLPKLDHQALPDPRSALARQWRLIRQHIWASVDPGIILDGKALVEQLRLAKGQRQPAGHIARNRFHFSQSISRAGWARMADEGMDHVSAWRAGRWDELFSGWELYEYRNRVTLSEQRQQKLAMFQTRRDKTGDPLARRIIDRLEADERSKWRVAPLDRPRRRPLWAGS